jgi:3-hydroxyisobutyrate dehydrogenase
VGSAEDLPAEFLLTGNPNGVPFALANACKDLTYYTQTAADAGVYREIAQAVTKTLQSAVDSGHGSDYIPHLAALLRT